jgi:hypothetical protein
VRELEPCTWRARCVPLLLVCFEGLTCEGSGLDHSYVQRHACKHCGLDR